MTKSEQATVNNIAENNYYSAIDAMERAKEFDAVKTVRLRTCQAVVISVDHWYLLRSYGTIVAVIDKLSGVMYDVLRMVYGYTATSAQHISKFWHDYGGTKMERYYETGRYTYR